jgi:ribosomal protein S12 methylthiotransferase accessory factor
VLRLDDLSVDEAGELESQLEQAGLDDYLHVAELIGVCPDPGTLWSHMRVGELRCLLALRTGDLNRAQAWSDWVLRCGLLSDERLRLFRCINQLLQFRLDAERHTENFEYLLQKIYGQPLLTRVRSMLSGEDVFGDVPRLGDDLEGLGLHRTLMEIYQRLQALKARHSQSAS